MKFKKCLLFLCLALSLVTALLLVLPTEVQAATEGAYQYSVSGGKATITKYTDTTSTSVTIPSKLGGYPVTEIGTRAFLDRNNIKSLIIPDTVITIGDFAFHKCSGLTSVSIGKNVVSIGDAAFFQCSALKSITIPDSVISIGVQSFSQCSTLNSITFGKKLTSVGNWAFSWCSSLTAVSIPDTVTNLGFAAFAYCSRLTSAKIGSGITTIQGRAFLECTKLTTVTIDKNVTSIESVAFLNCSLKTAYYTGTLDQWNKLIQQSSNSDPLKKVTLFYAYKETSQGNSYYLRETNGNTYYYEYGKAVTGWKTISGKTYYFKKGTGGTMAKGWTTIAGQKYYFKQADGSMVTGAVTISGVLHLFDSSGVYQRQLQAPKITNQPTSVTVLKGTYATVRFSAVGEGLTYKWYYKNKSASTFALTTSFTSNSYSTAMNEDRNGRQLYCVVTDKYGQQVKTNTVTISMIPVPKITKHPVSVTTRIGNTAKLTVAAIGEGLTYKWYYADKGATSFIYTSSFTGNTYSVPMTVARNGRRVYCVVTDKYGQTAQSTVATISMITVRITKQPVSVKVAVNQPAKVTFSTVGEGLKYKWYYADKGATAFIYTSSFTGNTYSVPMNAARDGRRIYCVVTDMHGNKVTTNTVTISLAAAPKVTKQPASVKAFVNNTAKVSFTASGEGLTYKWYYADKGATSFFYTSTFTGNTYSVPMTAARDGRRVYCVVTDKYGQTVKTATATLTMKKTVKITQQPQFVKVNMGSTASTKVLATGDGLTYKWFYRDKGSNKFQLTNSFKTNTYTTQMTKARDGRELYCVITDQYGNSETTEIVALYSRKATIKATVKTKNWTENGIYCGSVSVSSITGGSGEYAYIYEVYESKNSSSPVLRSSLTSNTDYAFESYSSLSNVVICVYIIDDEANITAYQLGMNGKILDTITIN